MFDGTNNIFQRGSIGIFIWMGPMRAAAGAVSEVSSSTAYKRPWEMMWLRRVLTSCLDTTWRVQKDPHGVSTQKSNIFPEKPMTISQTCWLPWPLPWLTAGNEHDLPWPAWWTQAVLWVRPGVRWCYFSESNGSLALTECRDPPIDNLWWIYGESMLKEKNTLRWGYKQFLLDGRL